MKVKKQQLELDMKWWPGWKLKKEFIKFTLLIYLIYIVHHVKSWAGWIAGVKIAKRNNNLRYADDTTLMAESKETLKSLLIRAKGESEKAGLEVSIQKTNPLLHGK